MLPKNSLPLPKKLLPCFEVTALNDNNQRPIIPSENLFILLGAVFTVILIASITIGHPFEFRPAEDNALKTDTDFSVTYLPAPSPDSSKLNINTAEILELMELPGVGRATAEAILVYRAEHGLFHSADELINVSGIGEKKLADILPLVTVD